MYPYSLITKYFIIYHMSVKNNVHNMGYKKFSFTISTIRLYEKTTRNNIKKA